MLGVFTKKKARDSQNSKDGFSMGMRYYKAFNKALVSEELLRARGPFFGLSEDFLHQLPPEWTGLAYLLRKEKVTAGQNKFLFISQTFKYYSNSYVIIMISLNYNSFIKENVWKIIQKISKTHGNYFHFNLFLTQGIVIPASDHTLVVRMYILYSLT
jgi:hypothetical protein